MTAAKSEVRKVLDQEGLPQDAILGHIVWFTIADQPHDLAQMQEEFDRLRLDTSLLPIRPSALQAYEKACTKTVSAAKPYSIDAARVGEIITVREQSRDINTVHRVMVREVRDVDSKVRLSYQPIGSLYLSRPVVQNLGGSLVGVRGQRNGHRLRADIDDTALVPGEDRAEIEAFIKTWYAEFDRLFNYVDGDRVRKCVRNYIEFLNGIQMKPGVYFVHRTREAELNALEEFVGTLAGCSMEVFPIPEVAKLRKSVIAAWEREAVEEYQKVVAAIAHVRTTRGVVTTDALVKLTQQYERVVAKGKEYDRILHSKQDLTNGAAEFAEAALNQVRVDYLAQQEAK